MTILRPAPKAASWTAIAAMTALFVAALTVGSFAAGTQSAPSATPAASGGAATPAPATPAPTAPTTPAATPPAPLQTIAYDPPPVQKNPLRNPLVVNDKTTQTECSACHMAYPAVFLPARSWYAIMNNLSNHFGEDASLDPQTATEIANYLIANAADADPRGVRLMRAVDSATTPASISDMPWWSRIHGRMVQRGVFKRPSIGSPANCVACHRGADKGYYGDD